MRASGEDGSQGDLVRPDAAGDHVPEGGDGLVRAAVPGEAHDHGGEGDGVPVRHFVEYPAGTGEAVGPDIGGQDNVPRCGVSLGVGGGEDAEDGVEAAAFGVDVEEGVADEEVGAVKAGLQGEAVELLANGEVEGLGAGFEGGDQGERVREAFFLLAGGEGEDPPVYCVGGRKDRRERARGN